MRPQITAAEKSFAELSARNCMNSKGIENVTLRGNEADRTASAVTERDGVQRLRDN